jgi:hypothetical protein
MHSLAAALVFLALLGHQADAAEGRDVSLTLPRALRPGDMAFAEIQLGLLPRGQEIEVTTVAGRALGVISPYGMRAGQEAGTYTLPIPADAFVDGKVTLRLFVNYFGHTQRAPTTKQVKSVRVKISPKVR